MDVGDQKKKRTRKLAECSRKNEIPPSLEQGRTLLAVSLEDGGMQGTPDPNSESQARHLCTLEFAAAASPLHTDSLD